MGGVEPDANEPLINRPGTPAPAIGAGAGHGTKDNPINLGALADEPTLEAVPTFTAAAGSKKNNGGSDPFPMWLPLAIIGGLAVVLVGGGRFAWEYGMDDLPVPARLWRKTQRLARWSKAGAPVGRRRASLPTGCGARLVRSIRSAILRTPTSGRRSGRSSCLTMMLTASMRRGRPCVLASSVGFFAGAR